MNFLKNSPSLAKGYGVERRGVVVKKLLSFLVCIFAFIGVSHAETMNLNWIVDGETYAQTTCTVGENVSIPEPAPTTKYGYHIQYTEYIPVEYIESTTVQYVDTGQKATLGTKIELKFKLFNNGGWLYRTETGSSTTLSAYVGTGTEDYWRFNRAPIWVKASDYALDTNISVQDKTGIIVNGIKKGSYSSVSAFTSRENIRFLCANARYYYFKHFRDNELIFDGVPVRRKNDNMVGILEMVSGQFFTNSGTGEFIAGPDL